MYGALSAVPHSCVIYLYCSSERLRCTAFVAETPLQRALLPSSGKELRLSPKWICLTFVGAFILPVCVFLSKIGAFLFHGYRKVLFTPAFHCATDTLRREHDACGAFFLNVALSHASSDQHFDWC